MAVMSAMTYLYAMSAKGGQMNERIDTERIEQLRAAAAEAGDTEQVTLCDLALEGHTGAIDACVMAIYANEAQVS